jgi:hypothetical protein
MIYVRRVTHGGLDFLVHVARKVVIPILFARDPFPYKGQQVHSLLLILEDYKALLHFLKGVIGSTTQLSA